MKPVMKAWSVIGLLFAAAILATIPISPQVTPRGVELSVDQAQAQITYRRARVTARREGRRAYRTSDVLTAAATKSCSNANAATAKSASEGPPWALSIGCASGLAWARLSLVKGR